MHINDLAIDAGIPASGKLLDYRECSRAPHGQAFGCCIRFRLAMGSVLRESVLAGRAAEDDGARSHGQYRDRHSRALWLDLSPQFKQALPLDVIRREVAA